MKALLFAGLAFVLAGSSLRAQEQSTFPRAASAGDDQAAQNSLIQQVLRLAAQATSEGSQPAAAATGAQPSADQTAQNSMVQQLVRLATQEITILQQKLAEADGSDASGPKAAPAAPAEAANPLFGGSALERGDAATLSKLEHAWDSSLSTGGLRTGGLQTGGLQTGTLQTGTLQASGLSPSRLTPSQTGKLSLPSPKIISAPPAAAPTTAAYSAAPILPGASNLPPAVSAPPGDPDEAMLRWSRRIDQIYGSEPLARSAALRLYPALAVRNSAFNSQFLARYAQYRQSDPFGFLRGPGWPMKLAIFTAGDLQRQRSGGAGSL